MSVSNSDDNNNMENNKIGGTETSVSEKSWELMSFKSNENKTQDDGTDFDTAIAETGYGTYNILLMLAVVPCVLANELDTSIMSYVIPFAECDLHLTSFDKGMLNGITYAGTIFSAFLWGFLSDTLGRKRILVVGYLVHGCVCLASSFSQSFAFLSTLKFISGFISNGPFIVIMSYVSEMHGGMYRARAVMMTGVFYSLVTVALPGMAWLIIPTGWSLKLFNGYIVYNSWNILVAVCALPSLIGGIVISFFDESPKFLMTQGRNEEAIKIFQKIYVMNSGNHSDSYPVKQLIQEKEQVTKDEFQHSITDVIKVGWQQVVPLFKTPHYLMAILVFSIQGFCFFGLNTIRLWLPQLFSFVEDFSILQERQNSTFEVSSLCDILMYTKNSVHNISVLEDGNIDVNATLPCTVNLDKSKMYSNSMICGAVNLTFFISASYFISIIGKKRMMVGGFFLAVICGLMLQWATTFPFLVAVISIFLSLGSTCCMCLTSAVVELFPTTLRAMAVSLTFLFGRIGGLTGNLLFPVLLDWKCVVPFYMVTAAMLVSGLLSILVPDRRGKMT